MEQSAQQIAIDIKQKALSLGFDLCRITSADPSARRDYYLNWLAAGQHGEMYFLQERADERLAPRVYFPPARSIVCVAMNYHVPLEQSDAPSPSRARVARYALGDDYHKHIKDRLHDLADYIRDSWPGTKTRSGVDTAPIMERELAARAGIGWQGKNSCIIHPQIGSWLFLGEVLVSLDLPPDSPATDHCGTCTRCIDACPTGAITAPYQLDARKCISYLTIEHEGEIAADLKRQMGDWLFGCDICQDVCPFNSRAPDAIDESLRPRFPGGTLDAAAVADWTLEEYHTVTRRSAMRRVSLPVFQRNARIARQNIKENNEENIEENLEGEHARESIADPNPPAAAQRV
ncbi:MAG: tRNA epoxyqueuosine(34) reductase QueG [Burkholderiales bacterium]|nr:tRNA epoxyqueuosine(34) reductase QueG [Phycisphaerae bacterium]